MGSGRTTAKAETEEAFFWNSYVVLDLGRDMQAGIYIGVLHMNMRVTAGRREQ